MLHVALKHGVELPGGTQCCYIGIQVCVTCCPQTWGWIPWGHTVLLHIYMCMCYMLPSNMGLDSLGAHSAVTYLYVHVLHVALKHGVELPAVVCDIFLRLSLAVFQLWCVTFSYDCS